MAICDLWFDGLAAPVRTVNCAPLVEGLRGYIPRWPFRSQCVTPQDYGPEEPCAVIANNGSAWLIQSPFTDAPRVHQTEVNVVCDLISILASALIAARPDRLCFHAAAVVQSGGLVLFPALRRAGKSTLSSVLAARGAQLFTDDYLPVDCAGHGPLTGLATGIAARLRLPLPEGYPPDARAYVTSHAGPRNRQYRYVGGPQIAEHGTAAPIVATVLLDRQDDAKAQLLPVSEGEALAKLAKQNFSRDVPAGEALQAMVRLVQTAPTLRLSYSDIDEAATLIENGLPEARSTVSKVPDFPAPGPMPDAAPFDPHQIYVASRFAMLDAAGEHFVGASHDGKRILQFDQTAKAVLDLLGDGASPHQVAELVRQNVQGDAPAALRDKTYDILRKFLKAGYIQRRDAR